MLLTAEKVGSAQNWRKFRVWWNTDLFKRAAQKKAKIQYGVKPDIFKITDRLNCTQAYWSLCRCFAPSGHCHPLWLLDPQECPRSTWRRVLDLRAAQIGLSRFFHASFTWSWIESCIVIEREVEETKTTTHVRHADGVTDSMNLSQ